MMHQPKTLKKRRSTVQKSVTTCKRRSSNGKKKVVKTRQRKKINQRGNGVFSVLLPLLATAISTAVASS